jgi:hypothetical protein
VKGIWNNKTRRYEPEPRDAVLALKSGAALVAYDEAVAPGRQAPPNRKARRRRDAIRREVSRLDALLREYAVFRPFGLGSTFVHKWGVRYVARRLGKPYHAVLSAALVARDEMRRAG